MVRPPSESRLRLVAGSAMLGGSAVMIKVLLWVNFLDVKATLTSLSPMILDFLNFFAVFGMVVASIAFYIGFILTSGI